MAALAASPPRTPSPKIRIHKSQSFDSPSSRISNTSPVRESPYSKSSSQLIVKPANNAVYRPLMSKITHTRTRIIVHQSSNESFSSESSSSSSLPDASEDERSYPSAPSPPSTFQDYIDEDVPMWDPWLVRIVLDLYDVRGVDWTMIAEPVQRMWGLATSSAEVLQILQTNGRVRRTVWWD